MVRPISFSNQLKEIATSSPDPFIRDSEQRVRELNRLSNSLPVPYAWRAFSDVAFRRVISKMTSIPEINRLYWDEMARAIEAYGIMSAWRSAELVRAVSQLLNQDDLIAPAILSRSLLELAATFVRTASDISKSMQNLPTGKTNKVVIAHEDLAALVDRGIYGTRRGTPAEHIKQRNALSHVQYLSRAKGAQDLLPTYEYLCELAHPNVVGNARFWANVHHHSDGSQSLVMTPQAATPRTDEIRLRTLWSLGWSSTYILSGFAKVRDAVDAIGKKWRS